MDTNSDGAEWMTTGEVARRAQVSSEAVRAWHKAGKLGCERTDMGTRLFKRADVDKFLAEREASR